MSTTDQAPGSRPHTGLPWLSLFKGTISVLVIFFIVRAVETGQAEFARAGFQISNIQWSWLLVAGIAYVLGMVPMGLNWHRLLDAMQQPVPRWVAVRAHFISQLGKYVPGKACVPAIRLALLSRYQVHRPTALLTMVAETLAMMSVGACIGASTIAVTYRSRPDIALVAAGLALCSGAPVIPPVLRFALRIIGKRDKDDGTPGTSGAERQLTWRVVTPGWLGIIPGWLLLGLSMWATMKALNLPTTRDLPLAHMPWITASYAISVVAGFASLLPGGVGIREWVMKELIDPEYGAAVGLLAPVLHRMVSLVSELIVSSMLYVVGLQRSLPPDSD